MPNLLSGRVLLNLMIWVIIDESFEAINRSCETLIVFVSRGAARGGRVPASRPERDRRFKDGAFHSP